MPNEFRVKRGLIVEGSGSNLVTIDGASGRLFSVNDSFSGSLFSVNTVAGLPVIEAFSDNTVRIGQFGSQVIFVSQSRVGIGKESALGATLDVSGSAIVTGSLVVSQGITGSLFGTSSWALNSVGGGSGATFPFTGSAIITGSLQVTGSVSVSIGSSTELQIRSTGVTMGSGASDSHSVTGSLSVSGSVNVGDSGNIQLSRGWIRFDPALVTGVSPQTILQESQNGNVFIRNYSNDTLDLCANSTWISSGQIRFSNFIWYPENVDSSNTARMMIGASTNAGTVNESLFLFTGQLRTQNFQTSLIDYSGSLIVGNNDIRGFYFRPTSLSGDVNRVIAWHNTTGSIIFGNLSGTGNRLAFVNSSGLVSVSSSLSVNSFGGLTISGSTIVTGSFSVSGSVTTYVAFTNTGSSNYTLVSTDVGRMVEMTASSACTLTVPSSSVTNFPIGSQITVVGNGAGQVTFNSGSANVLLRSAGSRYRLTQQYSVATLTKRGTDEWYLFGDLTI